MTTRPRDGRACALALFSQTLVSGLKWKREIVVGIVKRATPLPADACREAHDLLASLARLADAYRLGLEFFSLPREMRSRDGGTKSLAGIHGAESVVSRHQDALARALMATAAPAHDAAADRFEGFRG